MQNTSNFEKLPRVGVLDFQSGEYGSKQERLAEIILSLTIEELTDIRFAGKVEIGTFDNCRERGYTYKVDGGEFTYCVYEHRNSDQIIINGCKNEEVKPYGPYNGGSKYDYLECFSYNEYTKCAEELASKLLDDYKE